MTYEPTIPETLRVVLTDANVLYSRVLRDYLLYAAEYRVISVAWSSQILAEMTQHLVANRPAFTDESAQRLITAMTKTFPHAAHDPEPEHHQRLARMPLPDEDDRHVIAAALAAEADIVCTANTRHFPDHLAAELGLAVMTPDDLLCRLIDDSPDTMILVHNTSVANLPCATDESTMAALRKAGAPNTATAMRTLLGNA